MKIYSQSELHYRQLIVTWNHEKKTAISPSTNFIYSLQASSENSAHIIDNQQSRRRLKGWGKGAQEFRVGSATARNIIDEMAFAVLTQFMS